jgi:hypothetical protein
MNGGKAPFIFSSRKRRKEAGLMAGKLRGNRTKEELNDKIEAFAYAMVNITHGVIKDAYIYALQAIGIPEEDRTKNPAK